MTSYIKTINKKFVHRLVFSKQWCNWNLLKTFHNEYGSHVYVFSSYRVIGALSSALQSRRPRAAVLRTNTDQPKSKPTTIWRQLAERNIVVIAPCTRLHIIRGDCSNSKLTSKLRNLKTLQYWGYIHGPYQDACTKWVVTRDTTTRNVQCSWHIYLLRASHENFPRDRYEHNYTNDDLLACLNGTNLQCKL